MTVSRIANRLVGALMCVACVLASGCAEKPALVSAWPVASSEATVAPPADALRYPLTGAAAPDETAVTKRPLCVKVADPGSAAALTGVQPADVVYESADTGSHTQLACIFQSSVPRRVGPIGVAGMPDLWIVPEYGAALFSTGAPAGLSLSLQRAGLINFSEDTTASQAYARASGGVVLDGLKAVRALEAAGSSVATQSARLRFSATLDSTATPIVGVSIPFSNSSVVSWAYDSAHHTYRRSEGGQTQTEASTGKQITAANVVVVWAHYTPLDADIAGGGGFDVTLGGSGQASVFRDGQRLDGKWKADGTSPPRFVREDGSSVRLSPGNTWVEVIPLSANITLR